MLWIAIMQYIAAILKTVKTHTLFNSHALGHRSVIGESVLAIPRSEVIPFANLSDSIEIDGNSISAADIIALSILISGILNLILIIS